MFCAAAKTNAPGTMLWCQASICICPLTHLFSRLLTVIARLLYSDAKKYHAKVLQYLKRLKAGNDGRKTEEELLASVGETLAQYVRPEMHLLYDVQN